MLHYLGTGDARRGPIVEFATVVDPVRLGAQLHVSDGPMVVCSTVVDPVAFELRALRVSVHRYAVVYVPLAYHPLEHRCVAASACSCAGYVPRWSDKWYAPLSSTLSACAVAVLLRTFASTSREPPSWRCAA